LNYKWTQKMGYRVNSDMDIETSSRKESEKILLVLLPFWTPLMPPMGISCLKSFLVDEGYNVKTVDANSVENLRETYEKYFDILRKNIPVNKRSNFYSTGQDVLRNHMMAQINHDDEIEYMILVKELIYKNFYVEVSEELIDELCRLLADFYREFENYFLEILEEEKPSVLGVSVYNGTLPASVFACRLTRQKYPDIHIVMGGGVFADQLAPGTPNLDYFLETTRHFIDKIFIGEGELLFLEYLRKKLPDSRRVYTLEEIQWKTLDLSRARPPDFTDLDIQVYPYLGAYTSRSCPFQCKFCSETVQWGKYRKKKAQQIVAELIHLYEKHGNPLFFMSDSLLNPVLNDLAEEFIKSPITLYWDACIRAEKPVGDIANTWLWRRGGFYRARLGIETASPRLLDLMGKKITPEQSRQALINLAYAGIKTSTLWVIGYPGETDADFQETLDFIRENQDYIFQAEGTPFWYHQSGQVNSPQWGGQNQHSLLYPPTAAKMLITQTWIYRGEPSREKTYERLNYFTAFCEKLGIPLTYSLHDIYEAEERWKKLHRNVVPSLQEIKNSPDCLEDIKQLKQLHYIQDRHEYSGDFDL